MSLQKLPDPLMFHDATKNFVDPESGITRKYLDKRVLAKLTLQERIEAYLWLAYPREISTSRLAQLVGLKSAQIRTPLQTLKYNHYATNTRFGYWIHTRYSKPPSEFKRTVVQSGWKSWLH